MPNEVIEIMKDIDVNVDTQDAVEIANAILLYKFVVLGVIVLAAIAVSAFFLFVFFDARSRLLEDE